ncbi:MAG: HepT-like ribonuclease domain-containing protein [Candidatus Paceibacterota bacterium]
MIDKEFIKEKINLITRDLERLGDFSDFTISQMAEDFIKYSALKNILMEVIGRAIDINEHLIFELSDKKTEAPKTYKEMFLLLGEMNVLPKDFAKDISRSAGFRNAIVHEYNNLDKSDIYKKVGDITNQYKKYCDFILKYLAV